MALMGSQDFRLVSVPKTPSIGYDQAGHNAAREFIFQSPNRSDGDHAKKNPSNN
jgi:hypothetical protein